jgi:uncharacterized protein (DUF1800 family)
VSNAVRLRLAALLALAALTAGAALAPEPRGGSDPAGAWDARAARHLLNRAGFGATSAEIAAAVAAGREATVDALLASHATREPLYTETRSLTRRAVLLPLAGDADPDARRVVVDRLRWQFVESIEAYEAWWMSRLLAADDALRDRMTLFWHGLIPSNKYTVRFGLEMIEQHQLLREHALGSFRSILRGMARDGAMLHYLDNDTNVREHPNENWARELMELFTLGEGHYTEEDVQEAARAFTGWGKDNHRFVFHEWEHDDGAKTVLGVSGRLDGDDVIEIILRHPACATYLAGRLLTFFEGTPPDAARLADYAACLRASDYEVSPFLRKLLLDPEFYRDAIVGQRVAGPIDYLVGAARRLRLRVPEQMLLAGGAVLGQHLFAPPSVKGWDGDMAWISTSSMIQRSNLAGVLLGEVDVDALIEQGAPGMVMESKTRLALAGYDVIRALQDAGWSPDLDLAGRLAGLGARTDAAIVDALLGELLALPPTADLPPPLVDALRSERERLGVPDGKLLDDPHAAEPVLRRAALVVLSLPEAQLN